MVLGITATRYFTADPYDYIFTQLSYLKTQHGVTKLIHGGAVGGDEIADSWAKYNGVDRERLKPDYKNNPANIAPLIRNTEIVRRSEKVVAFWDVTALDGIPQEDWRGGTWDTIKEANAQGKLLEVHRFNGKTNTWDCVSSFDEL